MPVIQTAKDLIEHALDAPIGTDRLENLVSKDDSIVIVVNDQTRPGQMAEAVVKRINKAGVTDCQRLSLLFRSSMINAIRRDRHNNINKCLNLREHCCTV